MAMLVGRVTAQLRTAAGPDEVLEIAAQAAVPDLADRTVLVAGKDAGGERLAAASRRPGDADRVRSELAFALPVLRRLLEEPRGGRTSIWLPTVGSATLGELVPYDPSITQRLEALGAHSLIAVALPAEGREPGVLVLARIENPDPTAPWIWRPRGSWPGEWLWHWTRPGYDPGSPYLPIAGGQWMRRCTSGSRYSIWPGGAPP
jgi:hypothetical protein